MKERTERSKYVNGVGVEGVENEKKAQVLNIINLRVSDGERERERGGQGKNRVTNQILTPKTEIFEVT